MWPPDPVLLLVALEEGVLGLSSEDVHLGAHGVRVAGQTRVFPLPSWLAPGGWFVLYQTFFDQTVSRRLKDVQGESLDAALKKTTFLFTVFGKFRLLIFCTLFETLSVVLWIDMLPIPRVDTDIGNSIRLFPSLS